MSINLAPARNFNNYLRKFSKEDLIPPFLDQNPSKSEVFQAQLSWFVNDVRTPGTQQHIEYGQAKKTQLPLAVFGAVIGQNNEVAGRQLRLLDHGINGIVRMTDNSPVEIPHLTAHELRRLMTLRYQYETGASRAVHRADAIHGTARKTSTCRYDTPVVVSPALKRRLVEGIRRILEFQQDAVSEISAGYASKKELRVFAEHLWEADIMFHELVMEVAGWLHAPTYVRNLRCKMRLVGGYEDVVLGRAEESVEEHEEIADALFSLCDDRRKTEERLVELLSGHLEAAEKELLAILKKNYPEYYSERSEYDTPRLDLVCSLAKRRATNN